MNTAKRPPSIVTNAFARADGIDEPARQQISAMETGAADAEPAAAAAPQQPTAATNSRRPLR